MCSTCKFRQGQSRAILNKYLYYKIEYLYIWYHTLRQFDNTHPVFSDSRIMTGAFWSYEILYRDEVLGEVEDNIVEVFPGGKKITIMLIQCSGSQDSSLLLFNPAFYSSNSLAFTDVSEVTMR